MHKAKAVSLWTKFILTLLSAMAYGVTANAVQHLENTPCLNGCNYNLFTPITQKKPPLSDTITTKSDRILINKTQYMFSGNVEFRTGQHTIYADQISYQPAQKYSQIKGNIRYQTDQIQLTAEKILSQGLNKRTSFYRSRYSIPKSQLNGSSKRTTLLSKVQTFIEQGSISTCPVDSKVKDWHFTSSAININHVSGWAYAKRPTFHIRNTPVLVLPYIHFPIDKRRKTGVLFPSLSYDESHGVSIKIPWYWNINHNMDLLSEMQVIQKQGLWLSERFRHLGIAHQSQIYAEGIARDKRYRNQSRYFYGLDHSGFLQTPALQYAIRYHHVSDPDFFKDLESNAHGADTKYLDQEAAIKYTARTWNIGAKVKAFQSIADSSEKYKLLPQIKFNWAPAPIFGARFNLQSEYDHFKHQDPTKVQGKRATVDLDLHRSFNSTYSSVTLGTHHRSTSYSKLENSSQTSFSQQANTYYVEGKLFLERNFGSHKQWSQSLTPRLYYAYRKVKDESALPNFDTSATTFSYDSLFNHKRFSGKDRNGDLDRISLGLESKIFHNQTSQTALTLKIGQGYNLRTRSKTNLALEANIYYAKWSLDSKWSFSPNTVTKNDTTLSYQRDKKHLLSLRYQHKQDSYKKIELLGRWRIKPKWQWFGKINYSLRDRYSKESTIGVAYQSCCWETMVSVRRVAKNTDKLADIAYDNKIQLTFALRGLSRNRIDKKINDIIE